MPHPLPHGVTLLVWDLFLHWPIDSEHKQHLMSIETTPNEPLLNAHSSLDFHKYSLFGLGSVSATILRINPLLE